MSLRIVSRPSPNHEPRKSGPTDILLLHYTGMRTAEEALARLCDPAAKVSAHYTVDEDGTVFAHVPEHLRAFHAGVSYWAGERDINSRSIGVEIVNPGHEFGYRPFPPAQIAAVIELARGLIAAHGIPPSRVVGHSDVAPHRKEDPGELFPWAELAAAGVGLWPAPARTPVPVPEADAAAALARFGYGVPPEADWPLDKTIAAFQRHFRPARLDGVMDGECRAILAGLLNRLDAPSA